MKWRSVVDDACAYVSSRIVKNDLSDSDLCRLELLCAAYAYRLYAMCRSEDVSYFRAGDLTVKSPADEAKKAEAMWQDQLSKCSDLIKREGFLFGRVMS